MFGAQHTKKSVVRRGEKRGEEYKAVFRDIVL
jgi:hypothetical protein